jgi:hypothetical protein
MNRIHYVVIGLVAIAFSGFPGADLEAGGLKGGGGRGGASRGGAGMGGGMGGGMSRPSFGGGGGGMQRPNISAPSMQRPNISAPSMQRPNISAPSMQRPNVTRPSIPTGNISRPNVSSPGMTKPNISRPSNLGPSLGGGGQLGSSLKPSTRPSMPSRPSPTDRPTTLPSLPNRPNVGERPNIGERPSLGGVQKPTTLPGNVRPGDLRPGDLRPGDLRPGTGNLPGTRPGGNLGLGSGSRPDFSKPGLARPLPGDLGDFLGMDKPLGPSTLPGTTRPNIDRPGIDRPGIDRPGIDRPGIDRPGIDRPGIDRPGIDRPGIDRPGTIGRPDGNLVNRPIDIGNINIGNTVISSRPSWVTMDRNQYVNVSNRWQSQIGGIQNWQSRNPGRINYWNNWGNNVRHHWNYQGNCFRPNWWNNHPHGWGGWHYGHFYHRRPWNYWWSVPVFATFSTWFTWQAPPAVWSQPIYYDYGQGGNVTYNNDIVYINEQPVAPADQFAQSAAVLATVPPPADEEVAKEAEWMALGTFALATDEKDVDPKRIIQLAVNKQGIISGTMANTTTDEAKAIQGRVDKETQRVAFRIGESESVVCETGLYNLTQSEAPLLVHHGAEKVENYLLVRLNEPKEESIP